MKISKETIMSDDVRIRLVEARNLASCFHPELSEAITELLVKFKAEGQTIVVGDKK